MRPRRTRELVDAIQRNIAISAANAAVCATKNASSHFSSSLPRSTTSVRTVHPLLLFLIDDGLIVEDRVQRKRGADDEI